jgi:isoquinoline 1-oxidoreductase alpha subunit
MARISLTVNGMPRVVDAPSDTPLLWVLRDRLGLPGTKYGCGIGVCGACTVHDGGRAVRSCQVPVSSAEGRAYTTIEGLAGPSGLHPCQAAWLEEDVAQCGYCQPGMIMEVAAALASGGSAEGALQALGGHVCRCGTWNRIRRAVRRAALAR